MTHDQVIALFIKLTDSIHVYWGAFGTIAVLLFGWVLSKKSNINTSQKLALSFGWFVSAGYLASSLMGKYRLLHSLIQDVEVLKQKTQLIESNLLNSITEFSMVYKNYQVLVLTSFGLITLGVLFVIWSDVLTNKSNRS